MALPLSRSTMTACMFMVQSMAPTPMPKRNSTAPSDQGDAAMASSGSVAQISSAVAMSTLRQPSREVMTPASGIASNEPVPRHRRTKPRAASSRPALTLANGTMGAQAARAKPGTKKAARVACCWALREFVADWADISEIGKGRAAYGCRPNASRQASISWARKSVLIFCKIVRDAVKCMPNRALISIKMCNFARNIA